MLDPFKMTCRLLVAMFIICGLLVAGLVESAWYVAHNARYRIGSAIGETLRGIVHAIAAVFRA
jgi:hypothetical protein